MYLKDEAFAPDVSKPIAAPQEPWRKALLDAAEHLRKAGWLQGDWGEAEGPRCVGGALSLVTYERADSSAACYARCEARNALCRVIGDDDIVTWNNTPGRTKEQVISALTAAAQS